jgi:hypothetical protein
MDLTGLGAFADLGTAVINRIWPDATESERIRLAATLAELDAVHKERLAQAEVNQAEAGNPNLFVSGARPALLWCCVLIFFYTYILSPTAIFTVALCNAGIIIPKLAMDDTIWNLVFGLLGLGLIGARSYEKVKGVAAK